MSARHLSADRIQGVARPAGQMPLASPPVVSTYGSMPQSAANVVVRAAEWQINKGSLQVSKSGLICYGGLILALICFLPCWDSVQMLRSPNFVQWIGSTLPICMFVLCFLLIIFFVSMSESVFSQRQGVNMQNIALMCSLFITMSGLLLVVVSLPLSHETVEVANELAYDCQGQRARDVALAYDTLAALRATPPCASLESVEECQGFQASPEALYLKQMEGGFRCSGFCARSGAGVAAAAPTDAEEPAAEEAAAEPEEAEVAEAEPAAEEAAAEPEEAVVDADADSSLLLMHGKLQHHIAQKMNRAMVGPRVALVATGLNATQPVALPPTLFSHADYQTSCDGAASRDLLNFGREVGWQSWYTGIILVSISILVGILEWSSAVLA